MPASLQMSLVREHLFEELAAFEPLPLLEGYDSTAQMVRADREEWMLRMDSAAGAVMDCSAAVGALRGTKICNEAKVKCLEEIVIE